jgi:hypothetical protein
VPPRRRIWGGAAKPRGRFWPGAHWRFQARGEPGIAPHYAAIRVILVGSAKIASSDGKIQQKIKGNGQRWYSLKHSSLPSCRVGKQIHKCLKCGHLLILFSSH